MNGNVFRWCQERVFREAYRVYSWPWQYWLFIWPNRKVDLATKGLVLSLFPIVPIGSSFAIRDDGGVEVFLSRAFCFGGVSFSSGRTLVVRKGKVERLCEKVREKR